MSSQTEKKKKKKNNVETVYLIYPTIRTEMPGRTV